MVDPVLIRLWIGRIVYVLSALLIMFIGLVPLHFIPRFVSGPDLLICVTFAFALRRPDFVPIWLLAGMFLFADLLSMRPPGLWTAVVILAIEVTRLQEYRFRELVFPFEWVYFSGILFLSLVIYRLILSITLVPVPGFGSVMMEYSATVIFYPLVVLVCTYLLQVKKVTPDMAVRYGHRL